MAIAAITNKLERKKQLSLVKNVHTNAHTKYNKLNMLFAAYSKQNKKITTTAANKTAIHIICVYDLHPHAGCTSL